MSAGELPDFLAEVERAKWTAQVRVAAVRPPATGGRAPRLTAEQVAGRLRISEAQVNRLAKTVLRLAAVWSARERSASTRICSRDSWRQGGAVAEKPFGAKFPFR